MSNRNHRGRKVRLDRPSDYMANAPTKDRILQLLREMPGADELSLSDALGLGLEETCREIDELLAEGKIEMEGA